MSKDRRKRMSHDEQLVVDGFVNAMQDLAVWVDSDDDNPDDEPPGVNKLRFEGHVELLSTIHSVIGEDKLYLIKEIIEGALDSDMRCPK